MGRLRGHQRTGTSKKTAAKPGWVRPGECTGGDIAGITTITSKISKIKRIISSSSGIISPVKKLPW